jgi:enoyl-CoA hydratase/carnithine racemase
MADDLLRIERDGALAVLTFEDPERLNAMTEAMGHALRAAVDQLGGDPGVRAAVLTGAGRAFSAGGDLDLIESMAKAGAASPGGAVREHNRAFMERFYRLYLSVRELPFPTLAAIHGPAIGAGLCVALGCDLRVAARDAKLGLNFVRLGIHPGMGATWTLPRLVGPARAAELLFTGRIVDGAEAERIGLVNRAVARDEVLPCTLGMAREIAESAPLPVRAPSRLSPARSARASTSSFASRPSNSRATTRAATSRKASARRARSADRASRAADPQDRGCPARNGSWRACRRGACGPRAEEPPLLARRGLVGAAAADRPGPGLSATVARYASASTGPAISVALKK